MPTAKEKEELRELAKYPEFSNRCFVCHRTRGKGFIFHHLYYTEGSYTYRDKNYHKHLITDIKAHPEQFLLVCHKHHFVIEVMKKYLPETFIRLMVAVSLSRNG